MMKRSFLLTAAFTLLSTLAFATPGQAGTYTTQAIFVNTGAPANDFEATFTGTGGSLADLKVFNPVGATSSIVGGNSVVIDFATPLPTASILDFTFTTTTSEIGIASSVWTYTGGGSSPTGAPIYFHTAPSALVPEPTSMALLGIGMTSFLAFRRFFKRNSIA
jgi:hypothetical protein